MEVEAALTVNEETRRTALRRLANRAHMRAESAARRSAAAKVQCHELRVRQDDLLARMNGGSPPHSGRMNGAWATVLALESLEQAAQAHLAAAKVHELAAEAHEHAAEMSRTAADGHRLLAQRHLNKIEECRWAAASARGRIFAARQLPGQPPAISMGDVLTGLNGRERWLADDSDPLVTEIVAKASVSRSVAQVPSMVGELTEREEEVLRYLPTMLTVGEIAAELYVSVNTVKAHVRSIYRKLGASRRREAVVRAREYHFL